MIVNLKIGSSEAGFEAAASEDLGAVPGDSAVGADFEAQAEANRTADNKANWFENDIKLSGWTGFDRPKGQILVILGMISRGRIKARSTGPVRTGQKKHPQTVSLRKTCNELVDN